MFQIFSNLNVDWMGKRKPLIAISILVLVGGLASAIGRQMSPGGTEAFNLGVDFQGGTQITANFKKSPAEDSIREALNGVGISEAVIQRSVDKPKEILIKIPLLKSLDAKQGEAATDSGEQVQSGREIINRALGGSGLKLKEVPPAIPLEKGDGDYQLVSVESVGPVAGAELRNRAVTATLLGCIGILLFIAFRYDWTYAAGAVIAVFHDVLVTLAFFSIFQWEVNLTVLAAMLTLVGFSVNDSIVIFDRIRENLSGQRGKSLYQTVNDSVNQTMSRTIITSGLVFLSVLALVLFGGEVLRGFSLALLVGVIAGTYSTIAIASPIAIWWQDKIGVAEMEQPSTTPKSERLASSARKSVVRRG